MRSDCCSLGSYRGYHPKVGQELPEILYPERKGSKAPKIEAYQQIKEYREVIVYRK